MQWRTRFGHFNPGSFFLGSILTLIVVWVGLSFRLARIAGDAMAPTYMSGDVVLARAFDYQDRRPRRGDVTLLYYPLDPVKFMLDRVISTEGDTVQIFDGYVYVNDAPAAEDKNILTNYRSHENWGPLVTPQGYYFVIGDHRNASSDSRHWGFVPRRYLFGKVVARLPARRSKSND
jgi:signal peptidase I